MASWSCTRHWAHQVRTAFTQTTPPQSPNTLALTPCLRSTGFWLPPEVYCIEERWGFEVYYKNLFDLWEYHTNAAIVPETSIHYKQVLHEQRVLHTRTQLTHHSRYRLRIRCPRHRQSSTTLTPHLPTGSWYYVNHLHTHPNTNNNTCLILNPPHTHRCTSTRTTSTATPMAAQQLTRTALAGSSINGGQARKLTFERPSATSTWISVSSQFGFKKCSHCSLHRSPAPASSRRRLE